MTRATLRGPWAVAWSTPAVTGATWLCGAVGVPVGWADLFSTGTSFSGVLEQPASAAAATSRAARLFLIIRKLLVGRYICAILFLEWAPVGFADVAALPGQSRL